MKLAEALVVTHGDTIPPVANWDAMWTLTKRGGWDFVLPWRLWNERMDVEDVVVSLYA